MIVISINSAVKKRLLAYAESQQHQGHWGNAETTIPEHQYLSELIAGSQKKIELSVLQAEIVCQWILDAIKGGRILAQEDIRVVRNVSAGIEKYKKSLEGDNMENEELFGYLRRFTKICAGLDAGGK